jgi:hypothetical protein
MAHKRSHGGVKPKALGVIHILVPGQPSKYRLPE